MDAPMIADVLRTLAWGGSVAVVVALLAKFGEYWKWYQALGETGKRLVMFGLSGGMSLLAWAGLTYVPDSFWLAIQEPFAILFIVATGVFGNQLYHFVVNKPKATDTAFLNWARRQAAKSLARSESNPDE